MNISMEYTGTYNCPEAFRKGQAYSCVNLAEKGCMTLLLPATGMTDFLLSFSYSEGFCYIYFNTFVAFISISCSSAVIFQPLGPYCGNMKQV